MPFECSCTAATLSRHLLPRALKRARSGRLRLPSGPPKLVDCTYIDNAVDAHVLAPDRLAPQAACAGRAYFISQGEPLAISDLINRVLGAVGVPPVRKTVSPRVLFWAGVAAEAAYTLLQIYDREPPITRFVARQLTTAHWFNLAAARRDSGLHPPGVVRRRPGTAGPQCGCGSIKPACRITYGP